MSDESPTRRLSQIFGSLSCLSDLQHQEQLKKEIYGTSSSGASSAYKYASNTSSSTSSSSAAAASAAASLPSTSNQTTPTSATSMTRLLAAHNNSLSPNLSHSRIMMGSRSTPNSPRLMPKRQRAPPAVPQRPSAALIANPAMGSMDVSNDQSWSHFSSLTDHLDVRQVNNYSQGLPEINWQERCLELQLELHRSKSQAGRIRDMLRDKVSGFFFLLIE